MGPAPPITMEGGTTFHFVDDGIEAALRRAFDGAEGKDVRLGGGASTIQQYLGAGRVDEMHVAIVPILLGGGERLFDNLDGGPAGYEPPELTCSPAVVHVRPPGRRGSRRAWSKPWGLRAASELALDRTIR